MDLEQLRDDLRDGKDFSGTEVGEGIAEGSLEKVGAGLGLTDDASLSKLKAEVDAAFPAKPKSRTFDAAYRGRMHKALDVLMDRADRSQRMHGALDRVLQQKRCTGDRARCVGVGRDSFWDDFLARRKP